MNIMLQLLLMLLRPPLLLPTLWPNAAPAAEVDVCGAVWIGMLLIAHDGRHLEVGRLVTRKVMPQQKMRKRRRRRR